MSVPDYIGMRIAEKKDAKHHGVKGMKWGRRRTKAQLKAAAAARGDSPDGGSTKKSDGGSETSSQRYARLRVTAQQGKAGGISDEDLKWFNARTEALSKINRLNQSNPGWLKKTVDKVVKEVAEQQLKSVATALANKHVSGPVIEAVTSSQRKAIEEAVRKGIEEATKKPAK